MKPNAKIFTILAAASIFLGLPLLFYTTGDAPERSLLKEAISGLTVLSFGLMLGQYFLARSNQAVLAVFKAPAVQKVHKWIAYTAISIMAFHPFLIVFPRFFEGGVKPWDAFWTMITDFQNLGIVLGLIAWVLMVSLGVTAYFRMKLMHRFKSRYRGWRYFHGGLAVVFTVTAAWHSIVLGRHTDTAMSTFYIVLATVGIGLLARLYWAASPKAPQPHPSLEGAK